MFIQTEATPNPATLKFLPGRSLMQSGTLEIRDAKSAERSPLAKRLFANEEKDNKKNCKESSKKSCKESSKNSETSKAS